MYAIIEACGRQYKVQEGETVYFEKLDENEGKKVSFDKVVLISNDGKIQVGNPYVANAKVEGKVVSNGKSKKSVQRLCGKMQFNPNDLTELKL